MRGISHYSYPYLKHQKPSVLLINIYTLSSIKLEIRGEQFLLGGMGVGRERESVGGEEGSGRRGQEMTQTMYTHMNKRNKKKKTEKV
jgi:hypothetical protein